MGIVIGRKKKRINEGCKKKQDNVAENGSSSTEESAVTVETYTSISTKYICTIYIYITSN